MPSNPGNYGEVFKDLRIDRGIREREAYKEVCSRSTLCRFEAGISNIGLSTLVDLLKNIDVSTEEYFAEVRNYKLNVNEKFLQTAHRYYDEGNVDMLKEMLEELRSSNRKYDSVRVLMISILINELDERVEVPKQDFESASGYLIGVEIWGYSELCLLVNVIDKLNIHLACSITVELMKDKKFSTDKKLKIEFIKILLNVSYSCIKHECLSNADIFLEEAEALINTQRIENSIAERYVFKFIKGYYYLISGEEKVGIQLMKKAIDNFKTTEDKGIVEHYKKYYEEVMAHAKRREKIKID
jgi:Rgg/GadR/MutR family transcriptional activator